MYNKTPTFKVLTCKPVKPTDFFKERTCTLPKIPEGTLSIFCEAARLLVSLNWITRIFTVILFILWIAIIIFICRAKRDSNKYVKLKIAIPAMIAVVCKGLMIVCANYYFTPTNLIG